mmetsp:Transcript_36209/g.36611  ORF Transcript_36209/g.36611 Transcript_36209/m.36611 type:complete len:134 (+) Transcript_36209:720-1121(+)
MRFFIISSSSMMTRLVLSRLVLDQGRRCCYGRIARYYFKGIYILKRNKSDNAIDGVCVCGSFFPSFGYTLNTTRAKSSPSLRLLSYSLAIVLVLLLLYVGSSILVVSLFLIDLCYNCLLTNDSGTGTRFSFLF